MTEQEHLSEDTLFTYAADPASILERDVIDSHLDVCADCWTRLDDSRSLTTAMCDEETWWTVRELTESTGRTAFREFLERQSVEDAEAARMLGDLLASPELFARANVICTKSFHTGGVVRLLSEAARNEGDRDPRFSLVLAETAGVIADALPDNLYPACLVDVLRGTAWKEYSTTCRFVGRYEEGLRALDRAAEAYRRLPDADLYLASIDLGRALSLWDQEQYDVALVLARAAARKYEERNELVHQVEAREVEAAIFIHLGDYRMASEIVAGAQQLAIEIDDPDMMARTTRNFGTIRRNSGDFETARSCFLKALPLYESIGSNAMVVSTRWSLASLLLAEGNAREAAQQLPEIIATMAELEMMDDVVNAGLDLVEALLVLGRFDEAHAACTEAIRLQPKVKLLRTLRAVAYLKEAVSNRRITREQIKVVRTHLSTRGEAPDHPLLFLPEPKG